MAKHPSHPLHDKTALSSPKPDGSSAHNRLLDAAMRLLQQTSGQVPSLDEIAQEAGVGDAQAGALFDNSHAIYEAAAERALLWLNDACIRAVVKVDPNDSMAQFAALGETYIHWAVTNEPYFHLISGGQTINLISSPRLQRYHNAMRDLMSRMLERARDSGRLAADENIAQMVISGRSFAYGLARMIIDGRMAEWYPEIPPMEAAQQSLRDYVLRTARGSMPRNPAPHPKDIAG